MTSQKVECHYSAATAESLQKKREAMASNFSSCLKPVVSIFYLAPFFFVEVVPWDILYIAFSQSHATMAMGLACTKRCPASAWAATGDSGAQWRGSAVPGIAIAQPSSRPFCSSIYPEGIFLPLCRFSMPLPPPPWQQVQFHIESKKAAEPSCWDVVVVLVVREEKVLLYNTMVPLVAASYTVFILKDSFIFHNFHDISYQSLVLR